MCILFVPEEGKEDYLLLTVHFLCMEVDFGFLLNVLI